MTDNRETLVHVLVYHQATSTSGCICGWAKLGASHAEHVADVYALHLQSGEVSDGHHTHNELYHYRMLYNAAAANAWAADGSVPVVKSWRHSDGECFGGGWFIVVALLPTGQISNHYEAEHWSLFAVPEVDLPPEYDGHSPTDVAERLTRFLTPSDA